MFFLRYFITNEHKLAASDEPVFVFIADKKKIRSIRLPPVVKISKAFLTFVPVIMHRLHILL